MDAYYAFRRCKVFGVQFAARKGMEEAIMVDILRWASEFKKANSLCFETIRSVEGPIIGRC